MPTATTTTSRRASNKSSDEKPAPKADKKGKGLRHFAVRVCAKVEEKKTTTYSEVADELVREELKASAIADGAHPPREDEEKNIRRRVYDALNVLMAMGIIEKRKKEILWRGLPTSGDIDRSGLEKLQQEVAQRKASICEKNARVEDLRAQQKALQRISRRNARRHTEEAARVYIPFIVVRTDASTKIEVEVEDGLESVCFTFNNTFEVEDEQSLFRRLGYFDDEGIAIDEAAGAPTGGHPFVAQVRPQMPSPLPHATQSPPTSSGIPSPFRSSFPSPLGNSVPSPLAATTASPVSKCGLASNYDQRLSTFPLRHAATQPQTPLPIDTNGR